MAFRPRRNTPLLCDPYGAWCGVCGGRFSDARRRAYHHVDQRWAWHKLNPSFTWYGVYEPITPYDWDQYVVPVHNSCHASVDLYSNTVAGAVLGAYSAPPKLVEQKASTLYDTGDYAIAVRLRHCLRHYWSVKARNEDEQRRNLQFELVSAAGLWFFKCWSSTEFLSSLPVHLRPDPQTHPGYSLYLMNPLVTFGVEGALTTVQDFAAGLTSRDGVWRAKAARAEGIASLQYAATQKAEKMSLEYAGPHEIVTSLVSNTWALVNTRHDDRALDELYKIEERMKAQSWWQHFQFHFARGCVQAAVRGRSGVKESLRDLLLAQAVMVAKGYTGWVVPDVRQAQRPRMAALDPGDVLAWLVEQYGVPQQELDDLREEALPTLLKDLWKPPPFEWPFQVVASRSVWG